MAADPPTTATGMLCPVPQHGLLQPTESEQQQQSAHQELEARLRNSRHDQLAKNDHQQCEQCEGGCCTEKRRAHRVSPTARTMVTASVASTAEPRNAAPKTKS